MKTPRRLLVGLLSLIAIAQLPAQNNPSKADALSGIVKSAETDSVQYIERLAAYLFHQKLNAYRASEQLNTVAWDDSLWLAARNHTQYMNLNNQLGHDEKKGNKGYTGGSPGDRYSYATNDKGKAQWCGENALYNYSASGRNVADVAERIAQYSFEQWQASPGHNQNMLYENMFIEGTAFIINNDQVWATSLFARKPSSSAYNPTSFAKPNTDKFKGGPIVPTSNNTVVNNTNTVPTKKLSVTQMEKSIREQLTGGVYAEVETENALNKAAKNHIGYMAMHKTSGTKEEKGKSRFTGKNTEKRVMKTTHGAEIFKRMRTKIQELTFKKTYSVDSFDPAMAVADATAEFDKKRALKTDLKSIGMEIEIRKVKTEYIVYIVVLERRMKEKAEKEKKEKKKDDADGGTAETTLED